MHIMTKLGAAAVLLAGTLLVLAEPLRIEPLPVDSVIEGEVSNWQQQQGLLQLQLGTTALTISPAPFTSRTAPAGLQARAERVAHPAGPETRVHFSRGTQTLGLLANVHAGSPILPGYTLTGQDRLLLSTASGRSRPLPAGEAVLLRGAQRYCVQLLEVRQPSQDDADNAVAVDLLWWTSSSKQCRRPF